MFGISMFLYSWLKPYDLQSIGATLALTAVIGAVVSPFMGLYKMINTPRADPLSKAKIAVTLTGLAAILVAASFIPLPLHVKAPFLVEPAGVRNIYVQTPGELNEVAVKAGQEVAIGDILAVLANPQLEDDLRRLETELATERERARAFSQSRDDARHLITVQRISGLEERIAHTRERLAELTITAPIAGVIIDPPDQRPPASGAKTSLPTWQGSPLDPVNRGAFLEEGSQLLAIAPVDRNGMIEATLLVDQADRNDVFEDQSVELRFDHIPDKIYESQVTAFSRRHVDFAPPPLSNKYGGPLPTVSESDGRERLQGNAYQATVLLDADPQLMRPGLRGTARLDAANRSAWQWAWRYLSQTFYFRL